MDLQKLVSRPYASCESSYFSIATTCFVARSQDLSDDAPYGSA